VPLTNIMLKRLTAYCLRAQTGLTLKNYTFCPHCIYLSYIYICWDWFHQSQQVHTEPPLLLESTAARPVLYTIGVVGFVLFS
jgi:hypothetical protein